jgi:hypothetical protein
MSDTLISPKTLRVAVKKFKKSLDPYRYGFNIIIEPQKLATINICHNVILRDIEFAASRGLSSYSINLVKNNSYSIEYPFKYKITQELGCSGDIADALLAECYTFMSEMLYNRFIELEYHVTMENYTLTISWSE